MGVQRPRGSVGCSCGRRGEEGESRVVDIIENRAIPPVAHQLKKGPLVAVVLPFCWRRQAQRRNLGMKGLRMFESDERL